MNNELDETVNTLVYSNDASASVFGWDFQVNAAIFLALHFINEISDIKVESDLQDIEISLSDSSKIFAQAKSAQDYSASRNNSKRMKDGLLSLAKTQRANSNGLFVYISNVPDVFEDEYDMFNNDVRIYADFPASIKQQVDCIFDSIKTDINNKINENINKPGVCEKLRYYFDCVENFDKEKLCFSVIVPYIGSTDSRYKPIIEKIVATLSDFYGLEQYQIVSLKKKLLNFYQGCFLLNASTKDENVVKKIKRKELIWPAIALAIEQTELNPDEWCFEVVDSNEQTVILNELNKINISYHERFELVTQILTDFNDYKRKTNNSRDIEKRFANGYYLYYVSDFDSYDIDKHIKELITIWFLYRVVKNNLLISKITKRY